MIQVRLIRGNEFKTVFYDTTFEVAVEKARIDFPTRKGWVVDEAQAITQWTTPTADVYEYDVEVARHDRALIKNRY